MPYTPTVWQSGDIVTSTKLNKLETGVENASEKELPVVTSSDNGNVLTVINGLWAKSSPREENVFLDETAIQTKCYNDFLTYAQEHKIVYMPEIDINSPSNPHFNIFWVTSGRYDSNFEKYFVKLMLIEPGGTMITATLVADTATEPMTLVYDE